VEPCASSTNSIISRLALIDRGTVVRLFALMDFLPEANFSPLSRSAISVR
jgi:hypothetical protein